MDTGTEKRNIFWLTIIIGGIVSFIVFFTIATFYYPGGSNFDPKSAGYKWDSNYWCELLYEYSKNGHINRARPFGFSGMISLSIGVSAFWYTVPRQILTRDNLSLTTSITGILSMLFSLFIFTQLHDLIIYMAVICGTIAFSLLFYGIYKEGLQIYFLTGMGCLLLILLNCFIYITEYWINYLPSLQKATFVLTLLWISSLSLFHHKYKT